MRLDLIKSAAECPLHESPRRQPAGGQGRQHQIDVRSTDSEAPAYEWKGGRKHVRFRRAFLEPLDFVSVVIADSDEVTGEQIEIPGRSRVLLEVHG